MAVNIIMPKWGHTMTEGKITRWLKKEGDSVEKGEELFEVETEKITNIVEATASGILFQILVPAGNTAPVGEVVAILAEPGEELKRADVKAAAPQLAPEAESATAEPAVAAAESVSVEFVRATPAARRLAKQLGIDLHLVEGTGPDGRVTESDVTAYKEEKPPALKATPLAAEMARQFGIDLSTISGSGEGGKIVAEDVERAAAQKAAVEPSHVIPFAGMRKSIAENMHASLMNTAQLTAFTEVDVTEMIKFRDLMRKEYEKDEETRISFNDIFVLATSRALKRFPIMNSTLQENEIVLHPSVHIGIAVALPEGLMVPVLKDADKKGLLQIARETRELIRKARQGSISVDEVSGGTFTVTNLSMFNVDGFTPILRPPETGILGFCRIKKQPLIYNDEIAIRSVMNICLTFDHRVVDGAPASEFLQTVARYLEQPALILA
ncbi:MAG: 2-oxo acid dehydrogenase subunit E2 [Deltaproteobacteria bacterium]|nr:2-oxo acid dehydrogenase subunit E2 [Deltaproteobacteria bacterium]